MSHRSTRIGIDENSCRRLYCLQRRTGTSVRKLVNALVRDYLDATLGRRFCPRSPHRRRFR